MASSQTGEVITLLVGQAGCQIGNSIWELICAEHGVAPNGHMLDDYSRDPNQIKAAKQIGKGPHNFFYESSKGNLVPRTIFSDLEKTIVDEIKTGSYRDLFHPESVISEIEDAASIFARGYCGGGSLHLPRFVDSLRRQLEICEHCASLTIVHACGGGTGSGFVALLLDSIMDELSKITKLDGLIFPSGMYSTTIVEPYNAILSAHYTMEPIDVSFIWDNDALYNLCTNQIGIRNPNYNHVNRLTSQIFSSITACSRFDGPLSGTLVDYQTNLVPYPRIHYPITSYAPLKDRDRLDHSTHSVYNISKTVYQNKSQLLSVNVEQGRYVSCCLMYRGAVTPCDAYAALAKLKAQQIKFVDWCPTGMKVTICDMPPTVIPASQIAASTKSVLLMSNNSATAEAFKRIVAKYSQLYSKRSFVHWFIGEGMEEGEFKDAAENVESLIKDYQCCYDSGEAPPGHRASSPQGGMKANKGESKSTHSPRSRASSKTISHKAPPSSSSRNASPQSKLESNASTISKKPSNQQKVSSSKTLEASLPLQQMSAESPKQISLESPHVFNTVESENVAASTVCDSPNEDGIAMEQAVTEEASPPQSAEPIQSTSQIQEEDNEENNTRENLESPKEEASAEAVSPPETSSTENNIEVPEEMAASPTIPEETEPMKEVEDEESGENKEITPSLEREVHSEAEESDIGMGETRSEDPEVEVEAESPAQQSQSEFVPQEWPVEDGEAQFEPTESVDNADNMNNVTRVREHIRQSVRKYYSRKH